MDKKRYGAMKYYSAIKNNGIIPFTTNMNEPRVCHTE